MPLGTDLLGKFVVSGSGEPIGTVVAVERDQTDAPFAVRVREQGAGPVRERVIELEHLHRVVDEEIRCKGPRQGYHITRLGPPAFREPPTAPGLREP